MSKRNSHAVTLRLLGPLSLQCDGVAAELPGRKAQALLVYLARRAGEEVPRETLAGLCWADRDDAQARASLRQALTGLRRAFGAAADAALDASSASVRLRGAVEIDATGFAEAADGRDREALDRAEALYGGDLWEGAAPVAPEFDRWLEAERAALRARLVAALVRRMDLERQERDHEAQIATAARLLALDPLQENVHRRLMGALAAQRSRGSRRFFRTPIPTRGRGSSIRCVPQVCHERQIGVTRLAGPPGRH